MRIIDADVLVDKINKLFENNCLDYADRELFLKLIRSVPLESSEKKSTWMIDTETHEYICQKCGHRVKETTMFCSSCGSDMRFESLEYLKYNVWDIAKTRAENVKRKKEIDRRDRERQKKLNRKKKKKSRTAIAKRDRRIMQAKSGIFPNEDDENKEEDCSDKK